MFGRIKPLLALSAFLFLPGCEGNASVGDEDSTNSDDAGADDVNDVTDDDNPDDDVGDDDATDDDVSDDDAADDTDDDDDQLIIDEPDPTDAGSSPEVVVAFDGGDGGGVAACGGDEVRASQKEVTLLLVIDKSSSMLETDGDENDVDRWTKLSQATASALEAIQDDMSLGLEVFPRREDQPLTADCSSDESCCSMPQGDGAVLVPVDEGASAAPEIMDALSTITPAGGTPTARALELALNYFEMGGGIDAPGDRYVLLVTDGGPTCNADLECDADTCTTNIDGLCPEDFGNCCDAELLGAAGSERCLDVDAPLAAIQALAAANIRTAVMGIPGTEDYADQLNAYALAGGLPNTDGDTDYFAVSAQGGVEELEAALAAVTRQLVQTCVLELAEVPPDEDRVNVRIEGELVPKEGDDGWDIDVEAVPPTVTLKGATCERVESEGVEAIAVLFGCPTVLVQPRAR